MPQGSSAVRPTNGLYLYLLKVKLSLTGMDRSLGLQEVEAPILSKQ